MTTATATRTAKKQSAYIISKTTTLHVHHAFFVHFLAVVASLRHKTSLVSRARFMELANAAQNYLFRFLNQILSDSALDNFAKILQIE